MCLECLISKTGEIRTALTVENLDSHWQTCVIHLSDFYKKATKCTQYFFFLCSQNTWGFIFLLLCSSACLLSFDRELQAPTPLLSIKSQVESEIVKKAKLQKLQLKRTGAESTTPIFQATPLWGWRAPSSPPEKFAEESPTFLPTVPSQQRALAHHRLQMSICRYWNCSAMRCGVVWRRAFSVKGRGRN